MCFLFPRFGPTASSNVDVDSGSSSSSTKAKRGSKPQASAAVLGAIAEGRVMQTRKMSQPAQAGEGALTSFYALWDVENLLESDKNAV